MTKLKKIIDKFEKKSLSNKNWINSWVKIINESLFLLIRSLFNKDANTTLSIQNLRKEFEVRIYIKKEEKIKKIIIAIINNIINKVYKTNIEATLSIREKKIIVVERQFDIVIFKIKTKKSKRILKKNNFWTKKILSNASLCKVNYSIIIYKVKVKSILKNIKKDNAKTFIKINNYIYSKIIINKTK